MVCGAKTAPKVVIPVMVLLVRNCDTFTEVQIGPLQTLALIKLLGSQFSFYLYAKLPKVSSACTASGPGFRQRNAGK